MNLDEKTTRVLKVNDNSEAGISYSDNEVLLSGGEESAILVSKDFGTILKGRLALTNMIGDIRVSGLWKFSPLLMSTIPSSAITPVPVLEFHLPGQDFASTLNWIMNFVGSL